MRAQEIGFNGREWESMKCLQPGAGALPEGVQPLGKGSSLQKKSPFRLSAHTHTLGPVGQARLNGDAGKHPGLGKRLPLGSGRPARATDGRIHHEPALLRTRPALAHAWVQPQKRVEIHEPLPRPHRRAGENGDPVGAIVKSVSYTHLTLPTKRIV